MTALMSTHCPLPWNHLATHPQGDVSFCCRVEFKNSIGMSFDGAPKGSRTFYNLNRDSLAGILNSDSFKETRLKMLKGERPEACSGCYKAEDCGIASKRLTEGLKFGLSLEDLARRTNEFGEIVPDIEYAELRLGNLCNLKCRTCNPNSSSKWHTEYGPMQEQLGFVTKYDLKADFNWAVKEEFWADFLSCSSRLKMLYINGGEPTLISQHWTFLEKLIELGLSENIEIKYNINMTYLPANAFSIWKNFKSVYVGASIDDLDGRNSYIRYGADWEKILQNLRLIKDAGFAVAIEQTVSVYNIFYLDEMMAFSQKENLGYGVNFVYDPDFLSISCLPEKIRLVVLEKLRGRISEQHMAEINSYFKVAEDLKLWGQFKTYNEYLDKSRSEVFAEAFSEFADILVAEGFL